MAKKIDKILNQKKWTGEEVGRLFLINTIDGFIKALQGDMNPKPLFSQEKLNSMVMTLSESYDEMMYNRYVNLYDWLTTSYSTSMTTYHICQSNIRYLMIDYTMYTTIEQSLLHLAWQPLIMTSKEYHDIRDERLEEFFTDEDGSESGVTLMTLFDWAMQYYVKLAKDNPRKKNPIKKIIKDYDTREVSDAFIHENYGKVMHYGIFTADDGTTLNSLEKAALTEMIKDKSINVFIGENAHHGHYYWRVQELADVTDEEVEAVLNNPDKTAKKFIEVYSDEKPQNLTYNDFLSIYWEFYQELFADLNQDEKEVSQQLESFKNVFGDIIEPLLDDINNNVFDGKTSYTVEDLGKITQVISYREVFERDLYGQREGMESDDFIFDGYKRVGTRGIAILKDGTGNVFRDKNDHYEGDSIIQSLNTHVGLLKYASSDAEILAEKDYIAQTIQELYDSYKHIQVYDAIIDMMEEILKLEGLSAFKVGASSVVTQADSLDELFKRLKDTINDPTNINTPQEAEIKTKVIDEVYPPLNLSSIELPADTMKELDAELRADIKVFEKRARNLVGAIVRGEGIKDERY